MKTWTHSINTIEKLTVLAVCCMALGACAKTDPPAASAADEAAIRAAQNSWYKAFNARDAAAVAAHYTDDAVVSAPGVPAARGSAAIRDLVAKMAQEFTAEGLTAVEGPASEVGVSGDFAWQGDTYKVVDKSGATQDVGKTLTVFQRRDGKWMMIRDTWNSDSPPAAPASPAPTQ